MRIREVPILKRVIPSLRKRIAALTWPGGFRVVRRHDVLLLLNYRNYVDREQLIFGRYEHSQIAALTAAMAHHGCDLFVDAGAHIGLYSLVVATRRLAREVIAFEPDARSLGALRANVFMNGVTDVVDVRPIALSDHDGTVQFTPDPGTSTCRSRVAVDGKVSVPCAKLDTVLPISGKRLSLKIDIEGHELAALDGMRNLLQHNTCVLQIESFAANAPALEQFMHEMAYTRRARIGDDHYYDNLS